MKTLNKVVKWILLFLYRVSGLKNVVDKCDNMLFIYRKRLNMVPLTFKLFVFFLGVVTGVSFLFSANLWKEINKSDPVTFYQTASVLGKTALADTLPIESKVVVKDKTVDEIAEYIWMKESSNGKNNYSKCEAIGKINGTGFAIPGDGSYICFESHADEMLAVKGWIVTHKAIGMSELKMLCVYSGNNYPECKK